MAYHDLGGQLDRKGQHGPESPSVKNFNNNSRKMNTSPVIYQDCETFLKSNEICMLTLIERLNEGKWKA